MRQYELFLVARMSNGDLVRGMSSDFSAEAPFFHITEEGTAQPLRIMNDELKAVFTVKSFRGNPSHIKKNQFRDTPGEGVRKVWVVFADGEELAGYSDDYDPKGTGFFLIPPDDESNMDRAYVPVHATQRILLDQDAEEAASNYVPAGPRKRRRPPSDQWNVFVDGAAGEPPAKAQGAEATKRKSDEFFLGPW